MSEIIVYHGGTDIVETPICKLGRKNLDFGQGFYVTDIRKQALDWAILIADRRKKQPVLNRYILKRDKILSEGRCKIFKAYDYIEGGVANDRVVDTINLYMLGLMDIDTALGRLSQHQPNNQMCLLSQEITDKYLIYDGTETI